ncbi:putative baseplate assembly protein [Aureimonas sp. SA4125]|uniref:putative baseplate assembly protein n=1 Tax=Aureimonas sp. SA4125 TaxID=2826993 RepID=UPI001CC74B6C|nr:putative baseplate assembly protein [Aureimonas sp. SA4125]BDA84749.1 putative baseplate assembly protein [Aureimonas sp. SA4125]
MIYACCTPRRLETVRSDGSFNGIDVLEVLDLGAPAGTPRQRTLLLRLLLPAAGLGRDNVLIEGGERVVGIEVLWAHPADAIPPADLGAEDGAFFAALPGAADTLVVRTGIAGDYSTYTLRIVRSTLDPRAPDSFDPPLSAVDFSFKVECPSDFDCRSADTCAPEPAEEPAIDYLAKDYASFRRLMLDRMALLMPGWRDRTPADLGVALVETLAYVADHLSYQQDAIATEAYLGTARRRVSVRRHARLVDYPMHDGGAARVLVQLAATPAADDTDPANPIIVPEHTMLFTRVPGATDRIPITNPAGGKPHPLDVALRSDPTVYETMHAATLVKAHAHMTFYTWSDAECCLPTGATRATLKGHFPRLAPTAPGGPGDMLVFEEVVGPRTGKPEDADPAKRHAVRLLAVKAFQDKTDPGDPDVPLTDRVTGDEITELLWHADDALPFALCISSHSDPDLGEVPVADVTVARGNIVLADHGRTIADETLGTVPEPHLFLVADESDQCARPKRVAVPPRWRPGLSLGPLTHVFPYAADIPPPSARAALTWTAAELRPAITVTETSSPGSPPFTAERDLLGSDGADRTFVVEVEDDGQTTLRFGDGRHGLRPRSGARFVATYRIGQGARGNVGAEAIAHIVSDDLRLAAPRNPLPAAGGLDPEGVETVRQRAPFAFRTLERAVTPEDYAHLAERDPAIQRAAATFRWTGSWYTAFVTADRTGGRAVDDGFKDATRRRLDPYRMAGMDLEIDAPRFVPVELDLTVCVAPDYFRANVAVAVRKALGTSPDGLFHPDRWTFAQPVYLSAIIAVVQAIAGVRSVEVTRFHRQGRPDGKPLDIGRLDIGRLEIARLDNDPNLPEQGVLRLTLGGGK